MTEFIHDRRNAFTGGTVISLNLVRVDPVIQAEDMEVGHLLQGCPILEMNDPPLQVIITTFSSIMTVFTVPYEDLVKEQGLNIQYGSSGGGGGAAAAAAAAVSDSSVVLCVTYICVNDIICTRRLSM